MSKPELLPELGQNKGFSQGGYTSWSLALSVLTSWITCHPFPSSLPPPSLPGRLHRLLPCAPSSSAHRGPSAETTQEDGGGTTCSPDFLARCASLLAYPSHHLSGCGPGPHPARTHIWKALCFVRARPSELGSNACLQDASSGACQEPEPSLPPLSPLPHAPFTQFQ